MDSPTLNPTQIDFAILAEALRNPNAVPVFKENLISDAVGKINKSFGVNQLYKNILKCHEEVGQVSFETFDMWLESYPDLYAELGGKEGYVEFAEQLKSVESIDPDALTKLANRSYHKHMITLGTQEIVAKLNDDQANFDDLETMQHKLQERIALAKGRAQTSLKTALDIAQGAEDLLVQVPFIPTQYKSLNKALGYDAKTGGVMRGNIYAIVAMSGFGKSSLAKSLCNHWLDEGMKVLFINFEEAEDLWERVLMTQVTGFNVYKGFDKLGSVQSSDVIKKFQSKMAEWGERFMIKHDPESLYYEDLEAWLRDLYENEEDKRPDIVVIDTIQSLFVKSGGKARWGEFEQIMVNLEKLAKDMNAVFIITAQQNNNAVRENRQEVNQSDIGGGLTIVQKSSVTMVLMPRKTDMDIDSFGGDDATPIMEIHMPKNRVVGKTANTNPPLVRYDDDLKLYLDYDLAEEQHNMQDYLSTFGEIDPLKGI